MKHQILLAKKQGEGFTEGVGESLGGPVKEPPFVFNGHLSDIIGNFAGTLAGLAAIIAVGALTWGGIMWASSAGDEEKIAKAKGFIKWSIFGFILTLIAWSIVAIVKRTFTA